MGTRAAAFTSKIKNLQDAQLRLVQNTTVPGPGGSGGGAGSGGGRDQTGTAPTGVELATTLKWFSTTLLNVLKDVPGQPFVMMKSKVMLTNYIYFTNQFCLKLSLSMSQCREGTVQCPLQVTGVDVKCAPNMCRHWSQIMPVKTQFQTFWVGYGW
jgi:hypothetical protein